MKVRLLLCFISGILTGLSFNFSYLSWLVWFSLVPFIYVISVSVKIREAISGGILFGLVYYGTVIFWLSRVTHFGLILLLLYLAGYSLLFFFAGRYFLKRSLRLITLPCLWVILELVREHVWCGFGWGSLGYSQYLNSYLIQPADLLGVKFVSFVIVIFNVLIWEIFSKQKWLLRKTAAVFFLYGICVLYSFFRLNGIRDREFLTVALVQPNIAQELKWEESGREDIKEQLRSLSKETQDGALVVFPEACWPEVINRDSLKELKEFAGEIKGDSLIGVIKQEENCFYNTALLFDKEDSSIRQSYEKINLVPFGEYIPLRKYLKFVDVINSLGDMTPGIRFSEFDYRDKKFSVLICFEDIFAAHVRKHAAGKDFLVNITNDAWFGGWPEAGQHLGIMVFRAVENRIPIIRCANTGISGWVSSRGRIEKLKNNGQEVFFSGVGKFKVALRRTRSFYHRYGEVFPLFCGIVLFGAIIRRKGGMWE